MKNHRKSAKNSEKSSSRLARIFFTYSLISEHCEHLTIAKGEKQASNENSFMYYLNRNHEKVTSFLAPYMQTLAKLIIEIHNVYLINVLLQQIQGGAVNRGLKRFFHSIGLCILLRLRFGLKSTGWCGLDPWLTIYSILTSFFLATA